MNLVTNAYHAAELNNGEIFVQLREVGITPEYQLDLNILPGEYALLSVSDSGCGIDSKNIERIFDPYVTTKAQGKGTGLGLSVVYGIVKEHGGYIKVYSELGKGTAFNVYIPLIEKEEDEKSAGVLEIVPTGEERILLVDDEKYIVQLELKMLTGLGYSVTSFTSSPEALKAFKDDPDAYDLVITDMTMPHMTGDMLAKALVSIRPGIPVIICTGFSERMDKNKAEATGIKGFLMKPCGRADLAKMIRKVLNEITTVNN